MLHQNPAPEEERFYEGTHIKPLWRLELLIMATPHKKGGEEHLETSRVGHLDPLERILWGRSLPGGCAAASPPSPASEESGGVHISGGATVGYSSPHPLWRSSTGQIYHRITPVAPVEPHYKIYHRITPTVAPVELILVVVAPVEPHYTTAAGNRDARAAKYTPRHSSRTQS